MDILSSYPSEIIAQQIATSESSYVQVHCSGDYYEYKAEGDPLDVIPALNFLYNHEDNRLQASNFSHPYSLDIEIKTPKSTPENIRTRNLNYYMSEKREYVQLK